MYHIKSDRRSQRTAEEIGRGFLECLKEKPLSGGATGKHRSKSQAIRIPSSRPQWR